jgi:hypothetical protein
MFVVAAAAPLLILGILPSGLERLTRAFRMFWRLRPACHAAFIAPVGCLLAALSGRAAAVRARTDPLQQLTVAPGRHRRAVGTGRKLRDLAWMAVAGSFCAGVAGLLALSRGLRRGKKLFEQRYYGRLLIAVILVIMLFIQWPAEAKYKGKKSVACVASSIRVR